MSATPAQAMATNRHPRILACVLCQNRKIKCDRNMPCANCVKANVACTPSTPAPPRKRRRPNQDLQERLAKCEQLLKHYAGAAVPTDQPVTPAPSNQTDVSVASLTFEEAIEKQPVGRMVAQEGGARFVDSQMWNSFYDELQAMRDIVDTDEYDDSSVPGTDVLTPDNNADFLLPTNPSSPDPEDLQPEPVDAFRLWQMFLDRVNPLCKLVHVPTLQPYAMQATIDMSVVPLNYQALLFAIYLAAVLSLSEGECLQMLGIRREAALQKFTAGTKQALVRFDYLRNHDMAVLQALVLYLGRYDRHAAWILSGTVMRIAMKMGYHRDGELLNLNPFETEMRRRIWWQVLMQDCKLALISGLSHNYIPGTFDTKQPQNLNDADIFPGSTEPVKSREVPTEMAFCLVFYRLAHFIIDEGSRKGFEAVILGQSNPSENKSKIIEKYRSIVRELDTDLKYIEEHYVDASAGAPHAAALTIRPMLVQKLVEMLTPMQEQPEWGTEIFGPKDNLFKVVIMNSENNTDAYDRMSQWGFLWFAKLHFQLDVFRVLTGQLCQRPVGTLSDRGWLVVEKTYQYHDEMFDVSQKQYASQAQVTLKGWQSREQAHAAKGQCLETPSFIRRLREILPPSQDSRSSTHSVEPSSTTPSQQPIHDMNQIFGGYLDVSDITWDMWGGSANPDPSTMPASTTSSQQHVSPAQFYGNYGFGNIGNMG